MLQRGWFSHVFFSSLDLRGKMAEFPLLVHQIEDLENEPLFKSSLWIFMYQNVNVIVQIWSSNLAMCAIAKIGGCTQLIISQSPLIISQSPLIISQSPLIISQSPLIISQSPLIMSQSRPTMPSKPNTEVHLTDRFSRHSSNSKEISFWS